MPLQLKKLPTKKLPAQQSRIAANRSQHDRLFNSIKMQYKNPSNSSSAVLSKNIKTPINSLLCSINEKLKAAALNKFDRNTNALPSAKGISTNPLQRKNSVVPSTQGNPMSSKSKKPIQQVSKPSASKLNLKNCTTPAPTRTTTPPIARLNLLNKDRKINPPILAAIKKPGVTQRLQQNARRWFTPAEKHDRIKELLRQKEMLLGIIEEHERIKRDRQCVSVEINNMKKYIDDIGKKLDSTLITLAAKKAEVEKNKRNEVSATDAEQNFENDGKPKLRKIDIDKQLMSELTN